MGWGRIWQDDHRAWGARSASHPPCALCVPCPCPQSSLLKLRRPRRSLLPLPSHIISQPTKQHKAHLPSEASKKMSRSRLSSLFARSALATQASVSATSLLCSAIGTPNLPTSSGMKSSIDHSISTSLPWIDDVHNTISHIYLDRGSICSPGTVNKVVQMHPDATIENPIICYSGIDEIQRAFLLRSALSRDDTSALLECMHVEGSDDSIVAGERDNNRGSNITPPTVQVIYRLQKTYGSFFSMNTMLKVTIQCQNTDQCRKIMFQLPERTKAGVIATSGLTKNVVGGFNTASSGVTYAFVRDMWSRWFSYNTKSHSETRVESTRGDPSFVAEVIKIEECWNEVELIQPFYLSRRINGLFLSSLTYLISFIA